MHKLLARQLRRNLSSDTSHIKGIAELLDVVEQAYIQNDEDREMLERAMDLSSEELTRANRNLKSILDAIPDDIFEFNANDEVRQRKVNMALPYMREHATGWCNLYDVFAPDVAVLFDSANIDVLRSGKPYEFEFSCEWGDSTFYYEVRLILIHEERVLALARDITKRKLSEEQIVWLAYHDSLTGLPNKRLFCERVDQAINHSRRHHELFAVAFLDLDGFKLINDSMGHEAGDKLLQQVAERLQESLRNSDTVAYNDVSSLNAGTIARLGGDEFTILLDEFGQISDIPKILHRVATAISQPFLLNDKEVTVSTSIGVALYPQDGEETYQLLKNADIAMYHAKELGKNNFQFFTEDLNKASVERLLIEAGLKKALENEEFELYYQPQVSVETGKTVGLEALIRWKHSGLGWVSPEIFIPIAEDNGQILRIGEWVIDRVIQQVVDWQAAGYDAVPISINVSGKQLQNVSFVNFLEDRMTTTPIEACYLGMEITETSLLVNRTKTLEVLKQIKTMGIKLSLDDFGTGYSSLGYLKEFPIDVLKIDKSFIKDIHDQSIEGRLLKTIIDMGHVLDMQVIAEGVETKEQLTFLAEHQCDMVQGYFYSRPLPADEVISYLQSSP